MKFKLQSFIKIGMMVEGGQLRTDNLACVIFRKRRLLSPFYFVSRSFFGATYPSCHKIDLHFKRNDGLARVQAHRGKMMSFIDPLH